MGGPRLDPLCIVPVLAAAALLDPTHSDAGAVVTIALGMYGILLGIPVLLGVAIDAFRGRRTRAPRPPSRLAFGVHSVLLIAHDLSILFGGIERCSRGDYPYWLIGYIPLLLFANVVFFARWRQRSVSRALTLRRAGKTF